MADFYVDENGRVRRKKKETSVAYIVDENGNIKTVQQKKKTEEKAPAKETKKEEKEKERTWFQAGAFSDGYQFGDVSQTFTATMGVAAAGILEGAAATIEGVADAGAYLVAGGADLLGADSFSDDVKSLAKKEVVADFFKGYRDIGSKNGMSLGEMSLLGDKSRGVTNALGQIGTTIATGGIGKAAGLGAKGLTALTSAFMGASSAGSGISEAYKGGATDEEAAVYGVAKGTIDAASELIFGGLGKAVNATGLSHGISSLDDKAAKFLSDKIAGKIASETAKRVIGNTVEYGVKASGEGLEEVIAGAASAVAKKLTYMDEKELGEIIADENLMEQFIVGAVSSGIVQSPGLVSSVKTDTDFVSGRTSNEEAVFEKEVERRIAEEEANGTKVTNQQKTKIEEQVERDMERGYISTDTIEEVLGGDTYKEYKNTLDSEDALVQQEKAMRDEFNTLNRMKTGDMTGEQIDRREELRTQLSDITAKIAETKKEDSSRNQLKTRLSEEVSSMVRGDRLAESYNERERRKQAFAADLEQYTGTQRQVVEAAVKSGILNNTNRTHEFVDIISKISADKGVLFDFTNNEKLKESGFAIEGAVTNGYITKDGVTLNMDSAKSWQSAVGHEVTHVLEGTEVYAELQKVLFEYAKGKGEYDSRMKAVTELYQKYDPKADPKKELTADLVGDYLFNDADFVNNLSVNHRNIFQKIYDEIKYLSKVVTAGTKEARQLEKIKRTFEKAYKEGGAAQDGSKNNDPKHSLSIKHSDGTVSEISDARNLTPEDAVNYLKQAKNGQITGHSYIPVRKDTPKVIIDTLSQVHEKVENRSLVMQVRKAQQAMSGTKDGNRNGKHGDNVRGHALSPSQIIEIINKLDDPSMIIYQTNRHGKDGKALPNNVAVFVEYDNNGTENVAVIEFDSVIDPASIGTEYGDTAFHTVVTVFEPDTVRHGEPFDYAEELLSNPDNVLLEIERRQDTRSATREKHPNTSSELPSGGIISQNSEKSSGGAQKALSPEQEEYFKDSVVRDENGNLKVMYHGTSQGGHTAFDTYGAARYGLFGAGTYFTDNPDIAQSYTKKGRGTAPQVYEAYLNITKPLDMDAPADAAAWKAALPDAYFPESGTNENFYRAMEEYFEDTETPRWEAAETAMSVIEKMGFDGITHIGGGRVNADGVRHRVYIAFMPEQIKAVDNASPTADADIRNSLSDSGTAASTRGTPLRELRLETAPAQDDIAPAADAAPAADVATDTNVGDTFDADFAPYSEAEAGTLRDESFANVGDADAPPVMDAPYYGEEAEQPAPADPFDSRDIKDVGKRSVKAYMYENPEVKPFFQDEANMMLGELERTVKGERVVDAQVLYDTNGEAGIYGTKRHTSDDIAYLRDSLNYSYAEIEKGLKAIIEDDGKENNAVSKRIEFLLNDRLLNGYRDMDHGFEYPPNPDYVRLLSEKEISEYNDEARARFFENADAYAPPVETVEENFPIREDIPTNTPTAQKDTPTVHSDTPTTGDQVTLDGEEEAEANPTVTRKALHESIVNNIKERFTERGLDFDKVLKKAKDLSTFSTVDNTPQRVLEKAFGYKEGQILGDITVNKVAQNETEGIRWLNSFTDRKNGLLAQISKQYGIKPGSKKSAAAQMYAEGFFVDADENIIQYGDTELAADFPNIRDQEAIKGLAGDPRIRRIYDETLEAINASRKRNGYPEIPRLDNYFLHFRAMEDTFSRLGLPFNPNDIRAKDLPTDLNGVTADLKPGQPFFASAKHRTGKRTSFDMLGGLEKYLGSAKNQIYHIDDIQTLRALRNYIADTYGQAKGLESLDSLSDAEAEERIKEVYDSHLSTMAKFLNEEANVLAGKTSLTDRGLEGIVGRRGITFLDSLNRQVGANMVGFNVSSSLTNLLSVVQATAKTNKFDMLKAFTQTAANRIGSVFGRGDGFAEASPVMIRRRGIENFYRTPWQKATDAGYLMMGAVDSISTELITRAKYNELTRKGMDAQKAHVETDKWVSRLMGDRSLGQQPHLYNSKMLGIFTKFQLEVRNQLDSQFYDTIQEAKASTEEIENGLARNAAKAAKITSTFVQLAVLQHVFGKAFEAVAGYNPSFDILDVIIKTFGLDDDEEDEDTALDNIEEGFLALLGDLPYASTLTGGRIPIESALPLEQFVTGKDKYGNDKSRWETAAEAAPYYFLPGGYSQGKKTMQGLSMFGDDLPISGSYTDSGNLRFPVEDTPMNRAQAAVFGQWASGNARDYFDEERSPLKEKQIEEFMASGMNIQEYWKYRDGLNGLDTLGEKADYISGLDLPLGKKNLLINNIADRKEPINMAEYDKFADFEEFDFAQKNPEKYQFLTQNNVAYSDYKSFDEDTKEAWNWAYNNPEGFTLSKAAAGDVVTYRRYAGELDDIAADKDEDGKSISGSRKNKVIEYIDGLDIEYGQKILLFKNEYNADDTYNTQIIEYLDSREDISYEEMVTILTKLGFTVKGNTVTW